MGGGVDGLSAGEGRRGLEVKRDERTVETGMLRGKVERKGGWGVEGVLGGGGEGG